MQVLIDLNTEGRTILMVTHEDEVAALAKRQLHLRDGQKVFDGVDTAEQRAPASVGTAAPGVSSPESETDSNDVYSVDDEAGDSTAGPIDEWED